LVRRLAFKDVCEEGGRTVLTTSGPHGLRMRGRRCFIIRFEGTKHPELDGPQLRARILGADRLELLDDVGEPLKGARDTSMGAMHLPPGRLLWHSGPLLPAAVSSFALVTAGLATLGAAGFWGEVAIPACVVAGLALAIGVAVSAHSLWLRRRATTPLQQRLDQYLAKICKERPEQQRCARGPGRAMKAKFILELHEFFQAFIRDRTMYYVASNIVEPLTARWKISLAELVGPSPVEWFVSHYWGERYADTCAAIQKHAKSFGGYAWEETAYWVCTFSDNQYTIHEELGTGTRSWEHSSFYLALRSPSCRGTCLVLDERALPLGRSWCLFEILQTMQLEEQPSRNFEGLFFCTAAGVLNLGQASSEVALNVGGKLATLKLKNAAATCAKDKEMIDSLVVAEMGGFQRMDEKLRTRIRQALVASKDEVGVHFDSLFAILDHELRPGGGGMRENAGADMQEGAGTGMAPLPTLPAGASPLASRSRHDGPAGESLQGKADHGARTASEVWARAAPCKPSPALL